MKRVYVLLGGLLSSDGIVTSVGMLGLVSQLKKLPDTLVKWYLWADYKRCAADINRESQATDKVALIGYSGGGWRATTVANILPSAQDINLMVLYDPSPSWNMEPIGTNVKKAICYQNSSKMWIPFIGWVGGGVLVTEGNGPEIEVVPIHQQHLSVQFDSKLHEQTLRSVENL